MQTPTHGKLTLGHQNYIASGLAKEGKVWSWHSDCCYEANVFFTRLFAHNMGRKRNCRKEGYYRGLTKVCKPASTYLAQKTSKFFLRRRSATKISTCEFEHVLFYSLSGSSFCFLPNFVLSKVWNWLHLFVQANKCHWPGFVMVSSIL